MVGDMLREIFQNPRSRIEDLRRASDSRTISCSRAKATPRSPPSRSSATSTPCFHRALRGLRERQRRRARVRAGRARHERRPRRHRVCAQSDREPRAGSNAISPIRLVIVADEEVGSPEGRRVIERERRGRTRRARVRSGSQRRTRSSRVGVARAGSRHRARQSGARRKRA